MAPSIKLLNAHIRIDGVVALLRCARPCTSHSHIHVSFPISDAAPSSHRISQCSLGSFEKASIRSYEAAYPKPFPFHWERPLRDVNRLIIATLGCAAGLVCFEAKGRSAPPPVLHLQTYHSPSGASSLQVDPSDRYGRGSGTYRFSHSGQESWSGKLPFTLCDAAVNDDGIAVGYAYSHAIEGIGPGGYKDGPGNLHVVIMDATGRVRLNEVVKREHSRALHGRPEPVARGIVLHHRDDRFVMRMGSESGENWWVYRPSTGETVKRFALRSAAGVVEHARFALTAKAVQGVPLTLIHWWRYDQDTRKCGALFMLCDLEGSPVWKLELPADYSIPDNGEAESRLHHVVRNSGAILRVS